MNKILVVDDDVALCTTIKEYIKDNGFDVEAVYSAADALEKISSLDFMIVLSDIEMPDMTGIELLKKIKSYSPIIQVIIITGNSTMAYVVECLEYGAQDYLLKPFKNGNEIIDAINVAVKKVQKWKQLPLGPKHGQIA